VPSAECQAEKERKQRREEYAEWIENAREARRREYLKMDTEDLELNLEFAGDIVREVIEEILAERKARSSLKPEPLGEDEYARNVAMGI
jgi:hypothetical protein